MASDFRLKEQLPDLTEQIVDTYTEVGTINHLGHLPLPRYEAVISALDDLREILYPGYRRREGLHIGNVTYHVGGLIDGLHDKLTTQIARALRHEDLVIKAAGDVEESHEDYDARGQDLAIQFLQRIPQLRHVLATDVQAAFDGDLPARVEMKSSSAIPGLMPSPSTDWHTSYITCKCRSFRACFQNGHTRKQVSISIPVQRLEITFLSITGPAL